MGKWTWTFNALQRVFGATKLAHLDAAIAALDRTHDDDEIASFEASYRPKPILGHE